MHTLYCTANRKKSIGTEYSPAPVWSEFIFKTTYCKFLEAKYRYGAPRIMAYIVVLRKNSWFWSRLRRGDHADVISRVEFTLNNSVTPSSMYDNASITSQAIYPMQCRSVFTWTFYTKSKHNISLGTSGSKNLGHVSMPRLSGMCTFKVFLKTLGQFTLLRC